MENTAEAELRRRFLDKFLPEWCAETGLDPSVVDLSRHSWSESLAKRFLRTLDAGIVTESPGGRFLMPGARSAVRLFGHGPRDATPRTVTWADEAIIVISWAGVLHLDYDWPTARLGFESVDYAFDLVANGADEHLVIAGEAKPTQDDVDALVRDVRICGSIGDHTESHCGILKNHHRKYAGLVRLAPSIFWVFGPESGRPFAVVRFGRGLLSLTDVPDAILRYPFQT